MKLNKDQTAYYIRKYVSVRVLFIALQHEELLRSAFVEPPVHIVLILCFLDRHLHIGPRRIRRPNEGTQLQIFDVRIGRRHLQKAHHRSRRNEILRIRERHAAEVVQKESGIRPRRPNKTLNRFIEFGIMLQNFLERKSPIERQIRNFSQCLVRKV